MRYGLDESREPFVKPGACSCGSLDFRPGDDHGLVLIFRAVGADPKHIRHHLFRQRLGGSTLRHEATVREHQHPIRKSGGEPEIIRVDRTRWLVDGGANIDDVREQLGVDIPEGEYVTLGGFLFDALGHIPEEGERLDRDGWELRVAEMDKRRVAKVVVHVLGDTGADEEEPSAG